MSNERDRIPVAQEYIYALGQAAYNFAYLEWGIVWLLECICVGSIKSVSELTAGQIGKQFLKSVRELPSDSLFFNRLEVLAAAFDVFVIERNRLMHANPYSAKQGEQRLSYNSIRGTKDWSVHEIELFSDEAARLAIEAGDLLHGGLYSNYLKRQHL